MATEDKKKEVLKLSLEKVVLQSAGVKDKYGPCEPISSKKAKDKVFYPSLYLSSKEAPELSGSEAGQEKTVVLKAIIKSHDLSEREGKKDENFSLEIRKIGVIK